MEVEWPGPETGTATEVLGLEMVLELARRRLEAGRPRLKLEPELGAAISILETAPAPGDPEAEAAWREGNSAAPAGAMVDGENRGPGPQ